MNESERHLQLFRERFGVVQGPASEIGPVIVSFYYLRR